MTTNPFFDNEGLQSTQDEYESIIIEAIQIFGHDLYYVPRKTNKIDNILGEDIASSFNDSYPVEMWVENVNGYEGDDLFQKFGIEIRDDATLVVARKRFKEAVIDEGAELTRPQEGDLVYVPFSKSLFEITFVEHEDPFYQLGQLPVWKLNVKLFEYSDEDIDLDDIGFSESEFAGTMSITVDDIGDFEEGEEVTQTIGAASVTAEVQKISGNVLEVSNVSSSDSRYRVFTIGGTLSGSNTLETATITGVKYIDKTYGDNEEIENDSDDYTVYDPSNPFGDF